MADVDVRRPMLKRILKIFGMAVLVIVGFLGAGCFLFTPPEIEVPDRQDLTLTGVTVVNPGGERRVGQTMLVRGVQIFRIDPSEEDTPDPSSDSSYAGMYVLPGLIDMHVHGIPPLEPSALLLLRHGVTTVRDPANSPDLIRSLRERVQAGDLPGPRVFGCGLPLDGDSPILGDQFSQVILAAREAQEAVQRLADEEMDCVKVYGNLSPQALTAVQEKAGELGLPVLGHVPLTVTFEAADLDDVQHLWGVPPIPTMPNGVGDYTAEDWLLAWEDVTPHTIDAYVRTTTDQGIAHTPTLVVWEGTAKTGDYEQLLQEPGAKLLPPVHREFLWNPANAPHFFRLNSKGYGAMESAIAKMKEVVRELHEQGARVFVGTDAPFSGVVPGLSVHRELELFVEAGLTPEEAWAAATHVPGTFLGVPKLGTLQDGAPADFIIFSQDPTQDLQHLDTFEAVVADGRLYTKARLESAFERIHAHYDNPLVNTAWGNLLFVSVLPQPGRRRAVVHARSGPGCDR